MNRTAFIGFPDSYLWALCRCWLLGVLFTPGVVNGQSPVIPPTPQPFQFQPINTNISPGIPQPFIPGLSPASEIEQQNRKILEQQNGLPGPTNARRVQQMADVERDVKEMLMSEKEEKWLVEKKYYRAAFGELTHMNLDSFSITKAVYLVENAYLDDTLSFPALERSVQARALAVKLILKKSNLSPQNGLALNYAIQQLYEHANTVANPQTHRNITIPAFKYDFSDFEGDKDYRKMFASKMLNSSSGQCHSMPLVYLMIAEQLGAKAWLSLAPQHSFIQFMDGRGRLMNFETTNGNIVSSSWLAESGYINAKALRNKTYLDTLSKRKLYARCLADLLLGYLHKFGYDDFSGEINRTILRIDPTNLTALIVDANQKRYNALLKIEAAGKPTPADLPKYTAAYRAYLAAQVAISKVDNLGYQDMPSEAYQKWLQSIEQEKKRQTNKELNQRLQRQIQQLRLPKSTLKQTEID